MCAGVVRKQKTERTETWRSHNIMKHLQDEELIRTWFNVVVFLLCVEACVTWESGFASGCRNFVKIFL